jgi:uncharacterized protein (DUF488 family)
MRGTLPTSVGRVPGTRPATTDEEDPRMLYTVGYQHYSPDQLRALLDRLRVGLLVDVRSSPNSRKKGYSRKALESFFGERYLWQGLELGGRGNGPTAAGLAWLRTMDANAPSPLMLMCLEYLPGDCHRYHQIALPLATAGVECWHVVDEEAIETLQVKRALETDPPDYQCRALADVELHEVMDGFKTVTT